MDEIKIYGKLVNKTKDGIVADASQIQNGNKTIDANITEINDRLDNIGTVIDEKLTDFDSFKIYDSFASAEEDIEGLKPGSLISIKDNESEEYSDDYNPYVVIAGADGNALKEIKGGGGSGDAGQLTFSVVSIEGENLSAVAGATNTYECPVGTILRFKIEFVSSNYPDVRGMIYGKVNGTTIFSASVYPRDGLQTIWSYDTSSLTNGTYSFILYGTESTGKVSNRVTYTVKVGGLSINSKFEDGTAIEYDKANHTAVSNLQIPVTISSPDSGNTIYLLATKNDEPIEGLNETEILLSANSITIPASEIDYGSQTIKLRLRDSANKFSNILSFRIIAATSDELYLITDYDEYAIDSGNIFDIGIGVIQYGYDNSTFPIDIEVKNSSNEIVISNQYTFKYGLSNRFSLPGLKYNINDGSRPVINSDGETTNTNYSRYILTFSGTPFNGSEIYSKSITLIVFQNQNAIEYYNDGLICSFSAEGKSNSSIDREVWKDQTNSGKTVTFTNFNWDENETGNGWVKDENGDTALKINAGAYARINYAPFANINNPTIDRENSNGMTISMDFSTKNVLSAEAKVFSCLVETEGQEDVSYFLFDNFGDYVENDTSTIIEPEFYYVNTDKTEITKTATSIPFDYSKEVYYYTDAEENVIYTFDSTRKIPGVVVYELVSGQYEAQILSIEDYNLNKATKTYYIYNSDSETYSAISSLGNNFDITESSAYTQISLTNNVYSFKMNNIIRYFMYTGGYCWIDGKTYPGNGSSIYNVTMNFNNRVLNYNSGDENPAYDGRTDLRKFLGTTTQTVTNQKGFYVDTQNAVLTTNQSPSSINDKFHLGFSENTRTHIDFIINRNENSENGYKFASLVGYINGSLSLMQALDISNTFTTDSNVYIYLGGKGVIDNASGLETVTDTGECNIYSFKIYNRALSTDEILNNYAASIPNAEDRENFIYNNGGSDGTHLKTGSNANIPQTLPQITLIGANTGTSANPHWTINDFIMQLSNSSTKQIAELKSIKEPAYLTYFDPVTTTYWTGSKSNTYVLPIRLQFQGTSSMVYPCKNYKFKLYDPDVADKDGITGFKINNGNVKYGKKLKKDIGNGIEENCFCLKADFMDSSHGNNTGAANFVSFYNGEISGTTPASDVNSKVRTTVYGYPCLLYYKESPTTPDSERKFLGVYNINLDKSCTDSFGLDSKVKSSENSNVEYNFGQAQFIDDALSSDILVKTEQKIRLFDEDDNIEKDYTAMKDPKTNKIVAALSEKGYLRSLNNDTVHSCFCAEIKANSSRSGAGGFGNYELSQVNTDFEMRYEDDGDLEDEQYAGYVAKVGASNAESFETFKSPYFYHLRRFIKWISNTTEETFLRDLDLHFNRRYLEDYYLTLMLLGAVDSLGKNLMFGTWGPENHLYISNSSDKDAFLYTYTDNSGEYVSQYISPNKNIVNGNISFAKDKDEKPLYYNESCYNRYTELYTGSSSSGKIGVEDITTIPGECIWYPTFYDIDSIGGLDNSGQLIFDSDIEIGKNLTSGKITYNTADSWLWKSVGDYLGKRNPDNGTSELSRRWDVWSSMNNGVYSNLVGTYFYQRQISTIPVKYYNDDAYIKYIWEGPNNQKGSGSYFYCIHGSRYEQIKRWYSERIRFMNSYFAQFGGDSASFRSGTVGYDSNYDDDANDNNYYRIYNSDGTEISRYKELATINPTKYSYDESKDILYGLDSDGSSHQIIPIEFAFKTYSPVYVGVKFFNGGRIHMIKVPRNQTVKFSGNIKTHSDQEIFIYGGENIMEIGDISKYSVQAVDFSNLSKLTKFIVGSSTSSSAIAIIKGLSNNKYLSEINLENCSELTSTLDLRGCPNIKIINLKGSRIPAISLYQGGALEKISLNTSLRSLNLVNFANLSEITYTSLGSLTNITISGCPKIQGSSMQLPGGFYNSTIWNLLNSTRSSPIENTENVVSISVEAYGELEDNGFFFPDKYYNYYTAKYIKGELVYKGNKIPTYYTKFKDAFPNLSIQYPNITDLSEMFANYNNLDCIGYYGSAYTGQDKYGHPTTTGFYYWKSNEGWDPTDSSKYVTDTTYKKVGLDFYRDANSGTYYRLLHVHNKADLDEMRAEIKAALSNFTRVTNLDGMFKGNEVLDYLDPDTFNGIDLSSATTNNMFYGCTAFEHFEAPSDRVKNIVKQRYFLTQEGTTTEISEEIYQNSSDEEKELVTVVDWYYDPITKEYVGETSNSANQYSMHTVGLRNFGEDMFYGTNNVKVYIRKLIPGTNPITFSENAFRYNIYKVNDNGEKLGTLSRPVIMFEYDEIEDNLLGRELINENSEETRIIIDPTNPYLNFVSSKWLREVYFGVTDVVYNDTTLREHMSLSYALKANGKRILLKLETDGNLQSFNAGNELNIISETLGSIPLKSISNLKSLTYIIPHFYTFSIELPLMEIENTAFPVFVDKTINGITFMSTEAITSSGLPVIESIQLITENGDTEIPDGYFRYLPIFNKLYIDSKFTSFGDYAFANEVNLMNVQFISRDGFVISIINDDPNSQLTSIGDYCFANDSALAAFNIPDSVTELGDYIFSYCTSLKTLYVSRNSAITKIPNGLCSNCVLLEDVIWGSSGNSNRHPAFNPDITEIGDNAFYNCKLLGLVENGELLINNYTSLERIGSFAFYGCDKLYQGGGGTTTINSVILKIPTSMTLIGESAFEVNPAQTPKKFFYIDWDDSGDYSNLRIERAAFSGLYIQHEITTSIADSPSLYVPIVEYIGQGAFRPTNSSTVYKFCLMRNTEEEIGSNWLKTSTNDSVERTKKIVFGYIGIETLTEYGYSDTYLLSLDDNIDIYKEVPVDYEINSGSTYYTHNNNTYTETNDAENLHANGTKVYVKISGYAYLHDGPNNRTVWNVPTFITFDNKEYLLKEVLQSAFKSQTNVKTSLNTVIFYSDSELDLIEKDVFSDNLQVILTRDPSESVSEGRENELPENLMIESGNYLKESQWYSAIYGSNATPDGTIISLGRFILGHKTGSDAGYTLDLSDNPCDVIYDNAFDSESHLEGVIFSTNLTELRIFKNAFNNCSSLVYADLRGSNVVYIGDSAFRQCPFHEVFIPNTVKSIGNDAFTSDDGTGVGYMRSIFIEDGASFTGNDFFKPQQEITLGTNVDPSSANLSFSEFHIPSTMSRLLNPQLYNNLKVMAQIHNLYLGPVKVNNDESDNDTYTDFYGNTVPYRGTIYCPNIPIYKNESGAQTFDSADGENEQLTDEFGNKLYSPNFYYDLCNRVNSKNSALTLTTTESHGVYPLGDTGDSETYDPLVDGMDANIDLTYLSLYTDYLNNIGNTGIPTALDRLRTEGRYRDVSREDLLRMFAGLTRKKNTVYNVYLLEETLAKLTTADRLILSKNNINITFITA